MTLLIYVGLAMLTHDVICWAMLWVVYSVCRSITMKGLHRLKNL